MAKQNKILVVEDEAMNAMYLKMILTKAGYVIQDIVATGEDAVTKANEENPDIVLMDIRLAGDMDGIEAAMKIKSKSDVPIIFMTGYPDRDHLERAKAVNHSGYFIKPILTSELVSAIDSVLAL